MTSVANFLSSIAVNTHFNFGHNLPYADVAKTCAHIGYMGIKTLRDSCQKTDSPALWHQIGNATGAKFINYLPSGSPQDVQTAFALWDTLHLQGCVTHWEAPNEPDIAYAAQNGNSVAWAKDYLIHTIAPWAFINHAHVVATAYGSGWTATNNWAGNYDKAGDLSQYVTYGNAHTYPNYPNQHTTSQIQRLNALAKLVTPTRPIITTEIGWNRNQGWTESDVAKNVLQAVFGGCEQQNPITCFYGLYNDASGRFGLFNDDGTPTASAHALHNLTQLLKLSGSSDIPGPLYAWDHVPNDHAVMLTGANCSWICIWNEGDAPRTATVRFHAPQATELHWPLSGRVGAKVPAALQVTVPISDEVVLIRVS